jgi:uncharacterized membrane protein YdjX (TVP38/TMEM64 family)
VSERDDEETRATADASASEAIMERQAIVERAPPGVIGNRWLRVAILLLLVGGLYALGKVTGFLDSVSIPTLRTRVETAGALGVVLFVVLFALGAIAQVPGMIFVATGILVWGRLPGYFASLAGASLAVCASFLLARAVGGDAFAQVKRPWVRRILARLEAQPVRWLVALRLVFFISPPLNYALALTPIRFRDYVIGSVLGLATPMVVITVLFDWLFQTEWIKPYLF